MHDTVSAVTRRLTERSRPLRMKYEQRIDEFEDSFPRKSLSCTNLAHGIAACDVASKERMLGTSTNIGIVSSYNDLLSAHQPYHSYPELIKHTALQMGAVAQFAGGVPAMCDGITQGEVGMELSLFSRDVIAMATAVALSHNLFDAVLCLGICDKIVPGLLIGALSFPQLPVIFVPGGPMPSGLSNAEKAQTRQKYAEGLLDKDDLLESEMQVYHGPGTCTFYGTANTNQMCMEAMGLHIPNAAFIPPDSPLRTALTAAATRRAAQITRNGVEYTPVGKVVDAKAIVNAVVAVLASGGSTNHTLHLVAIARAAGLILTWDDFQELSKAIPTLTRIYPNGTHDINDFHRAGGTGYLISQLLDAGLLHEDKLTVAGSSMNFWRRQPVLSGERDIAWVPVEGGKCG